MNNIFTYWETLEGQKTPPYIAYCQKTLEICRPDFNIHALSPENVADYLKDTGLHSNFSKLKNPAQKADCVRVAILNKYGGIWIDSDTVMIKSPISVFEKLQETEFLYSKWRDGRVLNGYFLSRNESAVTREWLRLLNIKLATVDNPRWTAFGEGILTNLVSKLNTTCQEISLSTFLPVNVDKIPEIFFEDISIKAFLKSCTVAVGLNHSYFRDWYPQLLNYSLKQLLNMNNLLGSVIRNEF